MLLGDMLNDGAGPSALLVTAHPDDECMFFTPSIVALRDRVTLYLLCLSTGDFDGQGGLRAVEILRSCALLGIPGERVVVEDDPLLRDGPSAIWPASRVAAIVSRELSSRGIRRVITFDDWGVSGHTNHRAVHAGVRLLISPGGPRVGGLYCCAYELHSTGFLRKHLGLFDTLFTVACALLSMLHGRMRPFGCCLTFQPQHSHVAMREHASQYVWYRRLYLLTSRYIWLNELTQMNGRERVP